MLTFLAAVAQLEQATILERETDCAAIARYNGVYDHTPKATPAQILETRHRANSGVPKAKAARDLSASHQTLYAALSGAGNYAELVGARR